MEHPGYQKLFAGTSNKGSANGAPVMPGGYEWVALLEKLAHGDILKFDAVAETSYTAGLTVLSYWFERDEYERKRDSIK